MFYIYITYSESSDRFYVGYCNDPQIYNSSLTTMEVHHHAHHVPDSGNHGGKKKWKHYIWEFFMLFLAVFCGFLAENQREHLVEKHRAKEFARSLAYDFSKDTANMLYIINRINIQVENTDSLVAYVEGHKFSEVRNVDLFALTLVDRYPAYRWSRSTLQQIENTGSLRYFSDDIIRNISSYDALSHHMDEDHRYDEEWANRATDSKDRIVDISYPNELTKSLYQKFDSVIKSNHYQEFARDDKTPLLTHDSIALKVFLNEKINIRQNLDVRANDELKTLIDQCRKMISLLKSEYHFQ
jgi:hypothetical protein